MQLLTHRVLWWLGEHNDDDEKEDERNKDVDHIDDEEIDKFG